MSQLDYFLEQFMDNNDIEFYKITDLSSYKDICKFLCLHEDNDKEKYELLKSLNISECCLFDFKKNNETMDIKFCISVINNMPYIIGVMYWDEEEEGTITDIFNTSPQEIINIVKNKVNIDLYSNLLHTTI